eukprot:Skav218458  [mRNA]  locus=scaffold538:473779:477985:- [translate_table: standard]
MKCGALVTLLAAAVVTDAVADSAGCDVVDLLQSSSPRQRSSLPELAAKLLEAKELCLQSSTDCLPTLKQIRHRVWPYVQDLLGSEYEGFEPVDFHPQVAKASMTCGGENQTLVYMHLWKAAGYSVMENLKSVGETYEVMNSFEDDYNWCEELKLDELSRPKTFTFVRDPLKRFISGYAEIDRTYLGPRLLMSCKGD